jgi:hypothetical protein
MGRLLLAAILALPVWAADDVNPDEIIRKFAEKETQFQRARENYTYRQTVRIQELDYDGRPGGKYEIVSDITFGADGKRTERVVRAPMSTLQHILLTPEDEKDLRDVQPFVLNSRDIGKYDIKYVGKQKLDEIMCYQFSVHPKTMVKGERYFEGDIWVDDRDLQIVKTFGKGVGVRKKNDDNQFPKFETYREQIDGKYWFPTYTHADDTLKFQSGPQRITMMVKYQDYKQFKADTNITFGDEVKKPDK